MTKFTNVYAAAIAVLLIGCESAPPVRVSPGDPLAAINELMAALEPGLIKAGQEASNNGLELAEATIVLKTVLSDEVKGGLKILIFEAGQSKKETNTTEFTIKMTKPQGSAQTSTEVDAFVDALSALVSNAKASLAGLSTSEVKGTLKFVLVKTTTAGAGKEWEAIPVGVSASANLTSDYTQSVTIVFKRNPGKGGV